MTFPVIGITTPNDIHLEHESVVLRHTYVEAIARAGGAPMLIPSGLSEEAWRALYERLDGVLFSGGGDIAPERFDGEPHESIIAVDEDRDQIEFSLLEAVVSDGKPFLGICRGCQVVNVALGGTLYTDIATQMPNAIKHAYSSVTERSLLAHSVEVVAGSRLADIVGETKLAVNSLHHQGVKGIASALKPTAHAPDGLVEALELPEHPFGLAVQWHPEDLIDQPGSLKVFQAFVDACGKRK